MKVKKSRVEQRKQLYASNQQHILADTGLNVEQYINLWIDCGKQFLERHYPTDDRVYKNYYWHFHGKQCFWKWWLKKWNDWEADLVSQAKKRGVTLHRTLYQESMLLMLESDNVYRNFMDYISLLEDVL